MTVESTTRKQTFAGGQSSLSFSFRALTSVPSAIKVNLQNASTLVETALVYNTDYTVSINSNGVGGTVTVSPTYSTSYNYVVYRDTPALQESDYDDYNQFPANTLENSLDRLTMVVQEMQEDASRTLELPIGVDSGVSTELPTPEAGKYLGWNDAADAIENKLIASLDVVVKATQSQAEAASNDTAYMTPLQVKNEVQKAGAVLIPTGNYVALPTTSITTILQAVYPVGSIYVHATSTANPATILGFGTWTAFGEGRVLVGKAPSGTFQTVATTGGSETVTLTSAQSGVPAHTHDHTCAVGGFSGGGNAQGVGPDVGNGTGTRTISANVAADAAQAHANLQPYTVVCMWQRTA